MKQDFIQTMQRAIRSDSRSLYQLAQSSGLPYATVNRFARGERTEITITTAARLCGVLGLELCPRGDRKGR